MNRIPIASMDSPLNGFLNVRMSWSVFKLNLHNFLSVYDVYLNLVRGLPFLKYFNTVVVVKVTDRSFKTLLDTLNNLAVLIL